MTSEYVSCPQCGGAVDPQTRTCEHCGVGLALAALLAERDITIESHKNGNLQISPEILVPRLGNYLIERGVLSQENLQKALEYQAAQEDKGQPKLIGQTLLGLNLVDKDILDQVITEQILQVQSALQMANEDLEDRVHQRTMELENALNRLSELNQLKSNFIANISHELRTPLTHIKGYIELLTEGDLGPITKDQADALDVMSSSEARLENLIEDLIQFSLVARGQLDLKIDQVSLEDILKEVVTGIPQKCEKGGIKFHLQIPKDLPRVKADQHKIEWVLSQFLDNAVKFTPEGGEIGLNVEVGKKRATLIVVDSGIGIDPDQYDEIFEPFHQLDGSATRMYGGTGLGLAMAKQIIEAHGSEIKVDSTPGKGSSFIFTLPIGK
jgi:signal transduction histidine kinase